jgi:hypothetical protein
MRPTAPAKSSPSVLRVNHPGDTYEREADRAADTVMSGKTGKAAWSLSRVDMAASLQRECSCGGSCDECRQKNAGMLQREAQAGASGGTAPAVVHHVLRGSGRPLDRATRTFMESRFGHDFGGVRVFHDDVAARSARAVSAHAYTVGNKIVFNQGRYAPDSAAGRRLLAHELAHVVQQGSISGPVGSALRIGETGGAHESAAERAADQAATEGASAAPLLRAEQMRQPTLQRLSYAEIKESAYKKLVEGARATTRVSLAALRQLASHLPASMQGGASTLIDIADVIIGAVFAVVLAVIGIIVGIGEGVVDLVRGLVSLVLGVGKVLFDVIKGIFTSFDDAKQDWNAIVETFKALPGAVSAIVRDWLDRFEKAPSERQSLMIGELTGQIIALIATWEVTAGRVGTGAKVASEATDIGTTAADLTSTAAKTADVGSTAAKAARPALRAIQGGGQSAARTAATEGSAALKLAPELEQVPKFVPRIVPPPVEAPAEVATRLATGGAKSGLAKGTATVGIAAAKGTQLATDADEKKKKRKCEDAEPCGVLPIIWPSGLLPVPEEELVRTKADQREVEGIDRGPQQSGFSACISKWKKDPRQLDLEEACPGRGFYQEDLQPSEPIDAHHIHPLYLGGGDDNPGNLGAVEMRRHQQGHRELNRQQTMFDTDPTWAACNICSPNLSQHPVDQEYRIESS